MGAGGGRPGHRPGAAPWARGQRLAPLGPGARPASPRRAGSSGVSRGPGGGARAHRAGEDPPPVPGLAQLPAGGPLELGKFSESGGRIRGVRCAARSLGDPACGRRLPRKGKGVTAGGGCGLALRPCGSAPKGESLHRLGLGLLVRSHCGSTPKVGVTVREGRARRATHRGHLPRRLWKGHLGSPAGDVPECPGLADGFSRFPRTLPLPPGSQTGRGRHRALAVTQDFPSPATQTGHLASSSCSVRPQGTC